MKEEGIWYHLTSAEKLTKRYFIKHLPEDIPDNLSPIQMAIIDYLQFNQEKVIYQKDICNEFNIRRSTASGVLKNMEKNNIVISKVMGRNKMIKLSDDFLIKYKDNYPDIRNLEYLMEKGFTKKEIRELIKYLKKIQDNLREE